MTPPGHATQRLFSEQAQRLAHPINLKRNMDYVDFQTTLADHEILT
jgi:hypothetical protein